MKPVWIIDDDRSIRWVLEKALGREDIPAKSFGSADDALTALEAGQRPQVLVSDIRMPGMTGVQAAREIAQMETADEEVLPEIVFITAYDQYAVEAFEQGVVDYVLKPYTDDRLAVTVQRLKARLAARGTKDDGGPPPLQRVLHDLSARLAGKPPAHLKWIQASVGESIRMIPVDDVLFFISDEKYTRVQTETVEALIRKPIKELVDELDPDLFWQIHRSTLVNARAIDGITRDFRGRQLVGVKGLTEKLEVSRSYTHLFKGM